MYNIITLDKSWKINVTLHDLFHINHMFKSLSCLYFLNIGIIIFKKRGKNNKIKINVGESILFFVWWEGKTRSCVGRGQLVSLTELKRRMKVNIGYRYALFRPWLREYNTSFRTGLHLPTAVPVSLTVFPPKKKKMKKKKKSPRARGQAHYSQKPTRTRFAWARIPVLEWGTGSHPPHWGRHVIDVSVFMWFFFPLFPEVPRQKECMVSCTE